MADTRYQIVAQLVLDDRGTDQRLTAMDRRLTGVEKSARNVQTMFLGGLGIAGVGLALSGLTRGVGIVTDLGRSAFQARLEYEGLETRLSGLIQTVDGVGAAVARQTGGTILGQLAEDAAKGVGALSDYAQTFTAIFQPLRSAGATDDRIRNITRLALSTGFAVRGQEGANLAGIDTLQALNGDINARESQVVFPALQAAGISVDTFRAASRSERVGLLEEAFGAFAGAADAFGQTFEAQSATFGDAMTRLQRAAAAAPFEQMREGLIDINAALEASDDDLIRFGERLGDAAIGLGKIGADVLGLGNSDIGTIVENALRRAADGADYFARVVAVAGTGVDVRGQSRPAFIDEMVSAMLGELAPGGLTGGRGLAGVLAVGAGNAQTTGNAFAEAAATAIGGINRGNGDGTSTRLYYSPTMDRFFTSYGEFLSQLDRTARIEKLNRDLVLAGLETIDPTLSPLGLPQLPQAFTGAQLNVESLEDAMKGALANHREESKRDPQKVDVRIRMADDGSFVVAVDNVTRDIARRRETSPRQPRRSIAVPGA